MRVACAEALKRGAWHRSLSGHHSVRNGQSPCLTVELQSGQSVDTRATLQCGLSSACAGLGCITKDTSFHPHAPGALIGKMETVIAFLGCPEL